MIIPNLGYVILFVKNPEISAKSYSKILNLKPVEQSPTFVLFALKNGVMLGLWSSKTAEPPVKAEGGGMEIAFGDEGVDAIYEEWLQLGVDMIQKPTDMDFGRTFVARDPDGHRIRIYKLKEEINV